MDILAIPLTDDHPARLLFSACPDCRLVGLWLSPAALVARIDVTSTHSTNDALRLALARLLRGVGDTARVLGRGVPVVGLLVCADLQRATALARMASEQDWHRGDFALQIAAPDEADVLRSALLDDLVPPTVPFSPLQERSRSEFVAALRQAAAALPDDALRAGLVEAATRTPARAITDRVLSAWADGVLSAAEQAAQQARHAAPPAAANAEAHGEAADGVSAEEAGSPDAPARTTSTRPTKKAAKKRAVRPPSEREPARRANPIRKA